MGRKKSIVNAVFIGDTHVGCQLGLMSPEGGQTDEGLTVSPSALQAKVWQWWREFWDDFVPRATAGDPFCVVHLGDAIDGVHHGSTHQWTHNLGAQSRHAETILRPVVEACEGRYYHIRGTEAHVGPSSTEDERLACALGAIPNKVGQYARYELWKTLGSRLIHAGHHIGVAGSQAYESSALMREIAEFMIESARCNQPPPDALVRGHRHRCMKLSIPTSRGSAQVVTLPGWQLKTPFSSRIAGARASQPQFGGIVMRWSEQHQELFVREWVQFVSREEPE